MTSEQIPHTVRGWLVDITENGPSSRPVPPGRSDLIDTLLPDPKDMKPERGALAAIVSTRAYQRAKKILVVQNDILSFPSVASFTNLETFLKKNNDIGNAFKEAMINSLIRDERMAKKLPSDHPVVGIYRRLDEIVGPTLHSITEKEQQTIRKNLGKPGLIMSGSFLEVQGGIEALPQNMNTLATNIMRYYFLRYDRVPSIQTILRIMNNSYESYIEVLAKLHQADLKTAQFAENLMERRGEPPYELKNDSLQLTEFFLAAIENLRKQTRATRSRTTTCVFRTPTSETQPFLDTIADFEDPLRDAFNLHMQFLSA